MTRLTLGFIPLTDCAPLVVAQALGLFREEGLSVELSREASWATVRDKVAVGALDAAHMLAPMALATTLGARCEPTPMVAPLALAANGAAVTLSQPVASALSFVEPTPQAIGRALARYVRDRAEQGRPALTFAVVFPFSIHNYALRYWLAESGLDPDRDVRIVVVPPPRMVDQLRTGEVDGISVGAPWNTVAVNEGLGRIALRTSNFWRGGPDKVLGLTAAAARAEPGRLAALLRALVRAQAWADAPENRAELIALLARPEHVDAAPSAIAAALEDEMVFLRGGVPVPRLEHARWLLAQMRRWGQVDHRTDPGLVADQVYRPDLALEALHALDLAPEVIGPPSLLFDGQGFES